MHNKPIPKPYFEVRKDFKDEYVWVLRSARGDELAVSPESFKMRPKCTKAITMAKETMASAVEVRNSLIPD